jgi:hypothetical protein
MRKAKDELLARLRGPTIAAVEVPLAQIQKMIAAFLLGAKLPPSFH